MEGSEMVLLDMTSAVFLPDGYYQVMPVNHVYSFGG
jgi:hypothetical protein